MLKLSKLADYGTYLMTCLAAQPEQLCTATNLAEQSGIGAATVSKLLKSFSHAGLVESHRGHHGGYKLANSPAAISVASIIEALDGPIGLTECSHEDSECVIQSCCTQRSNWQKISMAIRTALDELTLQDMLSQNVQTEIPLTRNLTAKHRVNV